MKRNVCGAVPFSERNRKPGSFGTPGAKDRIRIGGIEVGTLLALLEERVLRSHLRRSVVFFRTPSLSPEQERFLYECVSNIELDEAEGTLNLDLRLSGPVDAAFERLVWQLAARPLDVAVRMYSPDAEQSHVETFPGHCSVASIHGYISGKKNLSTLRLRFNLEGWRDRFTY